MTLFLSVSSVSLQVPLVWSNMATWVWKKKSQDLILRVLLLLLSLLPEVRYSNIPCFLSPFLFPPSLHILCWCLRIIINQVYCSRANDDLKNTIRSKYIQLSLSICQIKWPVMVPVCLLQERNKPTLVLKFLSNRQKINKGKYKTELVLPSIWSLLAPNSTDCWIHLHCAAHHSYNCPFTAFSLLHPVHIFQSICWSQREKKKNLQHFQKSFS